MTIDYRLPENRRQHFLDLYEFNLQFGAMPGGVYFAFPWLAEAGNWDLETKLWFAFLNGNTQNPITSRIIFENFSYLPRNDREVNEVATWFNDHWEKLAFDTDRRYQKKEFPKSVSVYVGLVKEYGSQEKLLTGTFRELWKRVREEFWSFGRLAAFSYLEFVYIMGAGAECDNLFLRDLEGSKSHRNGLAIVSGHDYWDWRKDNPVVWNEAMFEELQKTADLLLWDTQARIPKTDPVLQDVGYFTLESNCCTYKSAWRPNRRYPGVYLDMMHDRIKWAEQRWPYYGLHEFWNIREECLPSWLRLECDPTDPGVKPSKQNHFRNTGQVIKLDKVWPDRYFDDGTWRKQK